MQVYNLGINDQTKSNEAKVTYQIIDTATNTVVFEKEQDSKTLASTATSSRWKKPFLWLVCNRASTR